MYWNLYGMSVTNLIRALNSNIRCIEMKIIIEEYKRRYGWIVTLDVLKSWRYGRYRRMWRLNSNIRCIEMMFILNTDFEAASWIVTLDVLKFK